MPRFLFPVLTLSILVAAVLFLPFEFPHRITTPGKVYPAREWVLLNAQNEGIEAILQDYITGKIENFEINRFERGDAIQVQVSPSIAHARAVSVGDTVATISSNEIKRQMATLTGSLASARATLAFYQTGEKPAIIHEEQMNLTRAQEQAEQHRRELDRVRKLRQSQVVPELDLEIAESQQRVYQAEINLAAARVEAVQTGEKPELIRLTQTQILSLENEINTLIERRDRFTITAPINGYVNRTFNSDTLLTVRDTDALIVVSPVPWKHHSALAEGGRVDVYVPGLDVHFEAHLSQMGNEVERLNGEEVLLVTALVTSPSQALYPGALVTVTIVDEAISLRTYLTRFFKEITG